MQRVLCWLFSKVYRRWLWNEFYRNHDLPLRVTSWRSALIAYGPDRHKGGRQHMAACFLWFD